MLHLRKQINIVSITAILVVGALAWQSQAVKRQSAATPTVLVSVDIEGVFKALEERAHEQSNLQALVNDMNSDLESRRQQIQSIEEEFELYPPGSAKWEELMQELQLATLEYDAQVEYTGRRAMREESKGMRRVYEHIREASAELSKENGWDYVFVNDAIVALPLGDNIDMGAQISSRRMLFANSMYDVTDTLVEYMNASFDAMAVR